MIFSYCIIVNNKKNMKKTLLCIKLNAKYVRVHIKYLKVRLIC